jgi:hypothetical protein
LFEVVVVDLAARVALVEDLQRRLAPARDIR